MVDVIYQSTIQHPPSDILLLLYVDACCGIADLFVEEEFVHGRAQFLADFSGLPPPDVDVADPWLRVVLRIFKPVSDFQSVAVLAVPSFLELHLAAVNVAPLIEPRSIVEADGIDNQRVAVPVADR